MLAGVRRKAIADLTIDNEHPKARIVAVLRIIGTNA